MEQLTITRALHCLLLVVAVCGRRREHSKCILLAFTTRRLKFKSRQSRRGIFIIVATLSVHRRVLLKAIKLTFLRARQEINQFGYYVDRIKVGPAL